MNSSPIHQAIEEAVIEVLEKMFFVSAVACTGAPAEPVWVEVAFQGDPPGRVLVQASSQAVIAIAANFLGLDSSEVEPRQVSEVAGELANMICGTILSRLESTATFRLSPPRVLAGAPAPGDGPSSCIDTGDGLIAVQIETESPICPLSAKSAS